MQLENSCRLTGNLTRDPELKVFEGGKVARFSIAVNGPKRKDKEKITSFFNCEIWNNQADVVMKFLKKGSKVEVNASAKQEQWEKDGVKHSTVVFSVDEFRFLDGKKAEEGETPATAAPAKPTQPF